MRFRSRLLRETWGAIGYPCLWGLALGRHVMNHAILNAQAFAPKRAA